MLRALLGVILTAAIWGANVVAAKALLLSFTPAQIIAGRLGLAALLLVTLCVVRQGWPRWDARTWLAVAGCGLLGNTVFQTAFLAGVGRSPAGIAGLTNSVVPIVVVLIGLAFGQRPGWRPALGVLVSLGGMTWLLSRTLAPGSSLDPLGLALLGLAALVWALYTLANAPLSARLGTLPFVAFSMALGALPYVLPFTPGLLRAQVPLGGWALLVATSLAANVFAYLAWAYGAQVLGPARTSVWQNLAPLVSLGLGAWLLRERLQPAELLAAAVILAGVLLTVWPARRGAAQLAPAD